MTYISFLSITPRHTQSYCSLSLSSTVHHLPQRYVCRLSPLGVVVRAAAKCMLSRRATAALLFYGDTCLLGSMCHFLPILLYLRSRVHTQRLFFAPTSGPGNTPKDPRSPFFSSLSSFLLQGFSSGLSSLIGTGAFVLLPCCCLFLLICLLYTCICFVM